MPKPPKKRKKGIMSRRIWLYGFTMSSFQITFGYLLGHRVVLATLLAALNATALTFLARHVYIRGKQHGHEDTDDSTPIVVHEGEKDDEQLKFKG